MFPKWSEKYATMQESEYRGYVAGVIENMLVLLFPLSALFSVFGVPVVRVLFEGGSFDASSSLSTGAIFSAYMLGMVGFALLDMLAKAYYAMGKTKIPLIANVAVIAVNFILNAVVLKFYPSAYAVAVITSVVMALGGLYLVFSFFGKQTKNSFSAVRILKSFAVSVLLYVALYFFSNALVLASDSKIMLVIKCAALGIVALVLYVVLLGKSLIVKKTEVK
jgi:putative peptidoglycan lipid II flippase